MAETAPQGGPVNGGRAFEGPLSSKSMANNTWTVEALQAKARTEIVLTVHSSLHSLLLEANQSNKRVSSYHEFGRLDLAYVEWIKAELYIAIIMQNANAPYMNDDQRQYFTAVQTDHANQRSGVKEVENRIRAGGIQGVKPHDPTASARPGSRQAVYDPTNADLDRASQTNRHTYYAPPQTGSLANGTPIAASSTSARPMSSPQDDPLLARFRQIRVGSESAQSTSTSTSSIPESLRLARSSTATVGVGSAAVNGGANVSKPVGPRPMPVDKELPSTPPRLSTKALLDSLPRAPSPIYTPIKSTQNPNATPPRTSSIAYTDVRGGPARTRKPFTELPDRYSIQPEDLFNRMKEFRLLLIDVRDRQSFDEGHIHCKNIICVEPLSLKPGMSLDQLKDDGMLYAPEEEIALLERLQEYDLVVYHDQETTSSGFLSGAPQPGPSLAMRFLHDTLTDFNEEAPLQREPVFLKGGLAAWIDLVSEHALTKSRTGPVKNGGPKPVKRRPHRNSLMSTRSVRDVRSNRLAQYQVMTADEDRQWREKLESEKTEMPTLSDYQVSDDPESMAAQTEKEIFMPFRPVQSVNEFFTQASDASGERQSMTSPVQSSSANISAPRQPAPRPPAQPSPVPPIPSRPPPTASRPSYSGVSDHRNAAYSAPRPAPPSDAPVRYQPVRHDILLHRTGLANFGNTCYMNSVIQCLSATIPLSSLFFYSNHWQNLVVKNWRGSNGLMPTVFATLMRALWHDSMQRNEGNTRPTALRPSSLRAFCARLNPSWGNDKQQDAQEFLLFILDVLHEDLNQNFEKRPLKELSWEEERFREQQAPWLVSRKEWQRSFHTRNSKIDDLFAGQWASKITCKKCGTTFTTHEVFTSLTLPIPRRKSSARIEECLKEFCTEEEIEYNCKPCGKERKALRKLTLTRMPNILVLSFNRYNEVSQKIDTPIDFPLSRLDMQPFIADTIPRPGSGEERHPAITPPFLYDCYAVVRHIGESARQGHYIAVARDPGRRSWREFNDQTITDFDPAKSSSKKYMDPKQAYIVFYERSVPR